MNNKLEKLKEPFSENEIKWRIQQSGLHNGLPYGRILAYVENRSIMDRLDSVVGAENWTNDFTASPNGGILCTIGIKINDEWVYKTDGAENTQVEAIKGGLSDSMKRAAVQWGIARYLYRLPDTWAKFTDGGKYKTKMSDGSFHKWNPPRLSEFGDSFLPKQTKNKTQGVK